MEDDRFFSSRYQANPRSLGLPPDRRPRPPQAGLGQRAAPPILERFRDLLKETDEELMASDGDDPPLLTTEEVVRLYENVLSELTLNSKPIITELTIIAEEQREHRQGITNAICSRILEVPVQLKLPSLYLLDSIVKNVGRDYVRYFAIRLLEVFCEAYNQVHSEMHPAMRHLFKTWSNVFPTSVLRKIGRELQFATLEKQQRSLLANMSHPETPVPRPSHGIHVNPKYLEARRRFEQSGLMNEIKARNSVVARDFGGEVLRRSNIESPKGWGFSSGLQVYEQKSSFKFGDNDLDPFGEIHPQPAASRVGLSKLAVEHASSNIGAQGPLCHLNSKCSLNPSLSSIGLRMSVSPPRNGFQVDIIPGSAGERLSSPQSEFGFGPKRASARNDWQEIDRNLDDDTQERRAPSAHNLVSGPNKHQRRDLSDTYENYEGIKPLHEKLPKLQRLGANGINSEATTRKWQISDENEYEWEDMSPTLANGRKSNNPFAFDFNVERGGSSKPNVALETNVRKRNWDSQAFLPPADAPATTIENGSPVLVFLCCSLDTSLNKKSPVGTARTESLHQISLRRMQQLRKSDYIPSAESQHNLSPESRENALQISFPVGKHHQKLPYAFNRTHAAEVRHYSGSSDVEFLSVQQSSTETEKHLMRRQRSPPVASTRWPPSHESPYLPLPSLSSQQLRFKVQFGSNGFFDPEVNEGPNQASSHLRHPFDSASGTGSNSHIQPQIAHRYSGFISSNQQGEKQTAAMRFMFEEAHTSFMPPSLVEISSRRAAYTLNEDHKEESAVMSTFLPNLQQRSLSLPLQSVSANSFQIHGGPLLPLPHLPPRPPPSSSQVDHVSQNTGSVISSSPAGAVSGLINAGLINSLVAQGLVSLKCPFSSQDAVGIEFDAELLKLRHESAINALYVDLSRQCTTCGLRFKCQEEHSNHMDWHVTRNRISRNCKQKLSRLWFVSVKEWLSGAEALGTDVVPDFLPTEAIFQKKEEKEMAVPTDESQNFCALCGEPFDDFYSDEDEEWMYKGAVYLNAPDGSTEGLERSQLGPIVHAKCISESSSGIVGQT